MLIAIIMLIGVLLVVILSALAIAGRNDEANDRMFEEWIKNECARNELVKNGRLQSNQPNDDQKGERDEENNLADG